MTGGMHDRGHAWQGVCMAGGMYSRGHAWWGMCMAGGMHGGGEGGCMHDRGHAWHRCPTSQPDTTTYSDMVNEQAVRILLECILVHRSFYECRCTM